MPSSAGKKKKKVPTRPALQENYAKTDSERYTHPPSPTTALTQAAFPITPPAQHRLFVFFFFHDPATTEIYTLSLHDALPISIASTPTFMRRAEWSSCRASLFASRSEEHTSELQSRENLVCRLLLEKKKE